MSNLLRKIGAGIAALGLAFTSLSATPVHAQNEFEGKTVKIGVVGSTMKDIMTYVAEKAAKEGITLEVTELNDYNTPNTALLDGDIDMNAFQHQVFLDDWNKAHNAELQNIGYTFAVPLRLYSSKYKSLDELPEKAKIAISSDPVGSAYAIKVLATDAKLFTLKDPDMESPTKDDIADNPKGIELVELDAAQIPTSMPDVDAGIIQDSFLKATEFKPTDAIYIYGDKADTLNLKRTNIFAVRKEDKDNKLYQRIVQLFQEEDVAKKITEISEGGLIPAWDLVKEYLEKHPDAELPGLQAASSSASSSAESSAPEAASADAASEGAPAANPTPQTEQTMPQ